MALLSYKEFLKAQESRAVTRAKTAAAFGTGVMATADVFGHSTPPPWQTERLLKKLKKDAPKKDIQEKTDMRPDYSFDRLVRKAAAASQEIDSEIGKAEKEAERLDKEKSNKDKLAKKNQRPVVDPDLKNKKQDQEDQDDDTDSDDKNSLQPKEKPLLDKKPLKKPVTVKRNPSNSRDDASEYKEEVVWLRLLGNTSFDPH